MTRRPLERPTRSAGLRPGRARASRHALTRLTALLVLVLLGSPALVTPASAATTYTQNAFRTTSAGQGVTLVANLGARPATTVANAGFCTLDAGGRRVGSVIPPALTLPTTGVTIRQTVAALPSGVYSSAPCVRRGSTGAYTEVGPRKTFTIAGSTGPAPRCSGRSIPLGTDVPAAVAAAPAGTTFCLAPGTHHLGSRIRVRSGDVFDGGNRAAVLDGGNRVPYAFQGAGTDRVTIRGLTIQHFDTPLQRGAVDGFSTTGWTIENNRITRNAAAGVSTGTGVRVVHNLIDHNGQEGYAAHGHDLLYEDNEIAYNNEHLAIDPSWEAGGGKAWDTQRATFRANRVHHNGGNGLWDDTNNTAISYTGNIVHDNYGAGIYHEIGYDAAIVGNTVSNNGTTTSQGGGERRGWLWDAGILLRSSQGLSASRPLLVADNTVTDNYNGIALVQSPSTGCTDPGEGRYGPCRIANVTVRGNVVTMSTGASGAAEDGDDPAMFSSRHVVWSGNEYHVSDPVSKSPDGYTHGWLSWKDGWPSFARWQGYGLDRSGSFGR